jgi:transposase
VIDWLREANQSAVGRQLQLSWHEVDGIMSRAVARGLARREKISPTRIGVDEISFQKRHEYVTVVTNIDNSRVIAVMDGRTEESLGSFLRAMDEPRRSAIKVAAMDMWPAYINAVKQHLPNAKIAFDRFHIAKHLGDAVNAVRKDEHRELLAEGDTTLTKTKYVWLQKPNRMKRPRRLLLTQLIHSSLRTARAWALKETASKLWHYVSETWARRAWNEWIGWTKNCKIEPMIRAASIVQRHLDGIINAIVLKTTNALGESMNAKIQNIKSQACGYRNRQRFRNAIMFHLRRTGFVPPKSHLPTRNREAPEKCTLRPALYQCYPCRSHTF